MEPISDSNINIPSEFISEIVQVMEVGLERANIPAKTRKILKECWEVERSFLIKD